MPSRTPGSGSIRRSTSMGPRGLALALAALVVLVAACAGAASQPGPQSGAYGDRGLVPAGGAVGGAAPTAAPSAAPNIPDSAQADRLIIRTGTLDLQVTAVDDAVAAADTAITGLGGYASGSERHGDGEGVVATITYRVPVEHWDDALTALRGLAIKVVTEQTGSDDVTTQVVDLGARITNLQATERALQAIMAQATKISDVLTVQAELTKVRGDIEQAQAERQHLSQQAALSTITVRFAVKPQPAVVVSGEKFDPRSEVDRASASLIEILQAVATAGIWFAIVWVPVLLVLGVLSLGIFLVLRRLTRPTGPVVPGGDAGPGGPPPDAPPAAGPTEAPAA